MYMRLVQAKFQPESLSRIQAIYEETIIPQLEKTKGCHCVVLLKRDTGNEGISLTLWDSNVSEISSSNLIAGFTFFSKSAIELNLLAISFHNGY